MYIYQKLLFKRVGLNPHALQLLCAHVEQGQITDRTARFWASGDSTPRNPYYMNCAEALDEHLTSLALSIIDEHTGERLILPYYATDDEYWTATNDMPCPVMTYHQLLQRITLFSRKPVHYLADPQGGLDDDEYNWALRQDWDNFIDVKVGFDF